MCHISNSMHFGFASLKGYGAAYRETDEAQRDTLAPLTQRQETCPIRTFLGITFVRLIQAEGGGELKVVWGSRKKLTEFEGEALVIIIWAEFGGSEAPISGSMARSPDIECFAPNL